MYYAMAWVFTRRLVFDPMGVVAAHVMDHHVILASQ